jgi:hypothetical protein
MKNYGKFVTGLIILWFLLALSASALHLFQNASNRVGIAVAIAAATPLVIFSLCFAASENFRQFTLSLDPRILTSAQAWRFIGFTFVLLEARGLLPAIFAWPAGYGDMAIGITAGFVAWKLVTPAQRNAFIFWQVLGIELGSDIPRAAIFDSSYHLHCPGKELEIRFRAHATNN